MDRRRILIVEDSRTQALHLKLLLEARGYSADVVHNGREALELLDQRPYTIVITDWIMPEMNGIAFCREVRNRPGEPYVYVILLTARGTTEDMVAGLEAGADDYLVKPVDPAELVARLKTARRILELQEALRQRNEELARLSVIDPLTGTYNRRYLADRLPGAIRQALRYRRHLSIVMCDIDHFKRVNDDYDHLMGDMAIQAFASVLLETIRRRVDWVVRFGGEEFVVVLPETDLAGAIYAAERYRVSIAAREIRRDDVVLHITASFGVAAMDPDTVDPAVRFEDLISVADHCLLQAKESGRNRTIGKTL